MIDILRGHFLNLEGSYSKRFMKLSYDVPASGQQGPSICLHSTSKMGKMWSSKHTKCIHRDHPLRIVLNVSKQYSSINSKQIPVSDDHQHSAGIVGYQL